MINWHFPGEKSLISKFNFLFYFTVFFLEHAEDNTMDNSAQVKTINSAALQPRKPITSEIATLNFTVFLKTITHLLIFQQKIPWA